MQRPRAAHYADLEAIYGQRGVNAEVWNLRFVWLAALIAIAERDGAAAVPLLEEALPLTASAKETSFAILIHTDLCTAHLLQGDIDAALEASRYATDLYRTRESHSLGAGLSPAHVWWWRHRALAAKGDVRQADKALETAYELLQEGIGTLSDEGLRRSYLNKIDSHRAIVGAWIAHARARRFSAKRRTAHLAGEADLRAPFERLVDTGMRLNELHSVTELHEFLVDEVTELSGAERVLLVLDAAKGREAACSLVPRGEDAEALLQAVSPLLDEARRTRAVSLRYVPESGDALDQRSVLVAPLIVQQRVLGYLYADIDGAFGRFRDTDRDLLGMLAAQAAVALDNVRFAEKLEQKVAKRTAQLEQRANELTLINSIQQGIAAELNFQAIIDLVGDKIREIYNQTDLSIRIHDPRDGPDPLSVLVRERRAHCHRVPTASGKRIRPARPAHPRDARHQREHDAGSGEVRQLYDTRNAAPQVDALRAARGGGPGTRPHQSHEFGTRACVQRVRRAAARNARCQHERGARQRAPVRRSAEEQRTDIGARSSARPPATTSCALLRSRRPTSGPCSTSSRGTRRSSQARTTRSSASGTAKDLSSPRITATSR